MMWDIGPLNDRELDVMQRALRYYVTTAASTQRNAAAITDNERVVAGELDQRCMSAARVGA